MVNIDVYLENFMPGKLIYQHNSDGSLKLLTLSKKTANGPLSHHSRAAIALNHACCEIGKGRVYVSFKPDWPVPRAKDNATWYATTSEMNALPSLLYVAINWTGSQQDEWRAMTPFEQLWRSWWSHGWLRSEVPVLPLGLVYHQPRPTRPDMDQFKFLGVTRCPVTLLFTPFIYLGRTQEFLAHCDRITDHDADGEVTFSQFQSKTKSWRNFEPFKKQNLFEVAHNLDDYYRHHRHLLYFCGDVLQHIIATNDRVYDTTTVMDVGDDDSANAVASASNPSASSRE